MTYTDIQQNILQKLLAKYESSKTYKQANSVTQNFSLSPCDVFPDYESDFTDVDAVTDFEKQVQLLKCGNIITITKKHDRIQKITAVSSAENWNNIRKILGVKEKRIQQQEELELYQSNLGGHEIIRQFCATQIDRITNDKKARFQLGDAQRILDLLVFILDNNCEILERELSIAVLHDSKLWEQKYKTRICKILCESSQFSNLTENIDDEKEANSILLEECGIFANPSYVYFKGNAKITFDSDHEILSIPEHPIALCSASIATIQRFEIFDTQLMTIENLTTFNRIEKSDTFFLYLSGYHNSAKQRLLIKIHEQNLHNNLTFYHFGDIDPDGFLILENLKAKTNIDFLPFYMNAAYLKKYEAYAKPLEPNDITKAEGLLGKNCYADVMTYMLKRGKKLEQEIISWLESGAQSSLGTSL